MPRLLSEADVTVAREMIVAEIEGQQTGSPDEDAQALSGVLEITLLQAVIPILVSLTSCVLNEVVKGKVLTALKRREAEQAIEELLKQPLVPADKLEDESLTEIKRVLDPLGLTEFDIERIYRSVKQRLSA